MTSAFKQRGDARREQPELFPPPSPSQKRMRIEVYAIVEYLRGCGMRVLHVSSHQNRIDGKLYTTREMRRLAVEKGFKGPMK